MGGDLAGGISIITSCENALVCNNSITTLDVPGISCTAIKSNNIIRGNLISCNTPSVEGIYVQNTFHDMTIENNTVHTAGIGIRLTLQPTDLVLSENLTLENNKVFCSGAAACISVKCYDYDTDNVIISKNTTHSIAGGTGILINKNSGDSGVHKNVSLKDNNCFGGDYGININTITKVRVTGNEVLSATNGLNILSGVSGYTVTNNIFENCATPIADAANAAGKIIQNNPGFNPVRNFTAPTLPATTVAYTNAFGYPCMVTVYGGTVTAIAIDGIFSGLTSGSFILNAGDTITLTYSAAPTWKWWGL
jgi:nitrous oxidase accessory protein NosD